MRGRRWQVIGVRTIIARACVLVLLGAVVNVAVAWVAVWEPFRGGRQLVRFGPEPEDQASWRDHAPPEIRELIVNSKCIAYYLLLEQTDWVAFNNAYSARDRQSAIRVMTVAGFPIRCMQGTMWGYTDVSGNDVEFYQTAFGSYNRIRPLRPIWPGFAINTLFYAAILWLLFAVPFALRRWRRSKRGLCPACAYPVGVSPVCTECGKPVKRIADEPRV